jgi:hypothetical protein
MTNIEHLADDALEAVHANLHAALRSSDEFDTAQMEAHHLVTTEMTKRGLDHGHIDDIWTEIVIEKQTTPHLPLAEALADLPEAVAKSVIEQLGPINFVDATSILGVDGYSVRFDASADQIVEAPEPVLKDYPASVPLSPTQDALYRGYEAVAGQIGGFDQTAGADGAHYMGGSLNLFAEDGLRCANCVFFEGGGACEIVRGQIDPDGICKFWIIPEHLLVEAEVEVEAPEPTEKAAPLVSSTAPATSITYVVNLPGAEATMLKHGEHNQKDHGKWSAGMGKGDMDIIKRLLSKSAIKFAYSDAYENGLRLRDDSPDWVERSVASRRESLAKNLTHLREHAPRRQSVGTDEFAVIAESILDDQGFIDGATGARRAVRPPLFGSSVAAYMTTVDGFAKHAEHDQKTHGRRFSASVSTELSDSILARVKENGGLSVSMVDGHEPSSGYMVGKGAKYGDIAEADDFFDPVKGHKILAGYLIKHKRDLGSGKAYLGLWHNTENGKVYLDLSDNIQDRAKATSLGRRRDQISIWDVANFAEIETGGTGEINKGVAHGGEAGTAQGDSDSRGLRSDVRRGDHGLGQGRLGEGHRADGEVAKHGEHNQSDHGNWANGGGSVPALAENKKAAPGQYSEEAVKAAAEVRAHAETLEPGATEIMVRMSRQFGGKLEQLDQRLKTEESLARKIDADAVKDYNGDRERAAANLSDAIRYTMVFGDANYTEGMKATIKTMEADGYTFLDANGESRVKNFWFDGDDYQGINAKAAKDGMIVELQFHTPESLDFKEGRSFKADPGNEQVRVRFGDKAGKMVPLSLHALYENYRQETDLRVKWQDWSAMVRLAAQIPKPSKYQELLTIGKKSVKRFNKSRSPKTTGVGTLPAGGTQ